MQTNVFLFVRLQTVVRLTSSGLRCVDDDRVWLLPVFLPVQIRRNVPSTLNSTDMVSFPNSKARFCLRLRLIGRQFNTQLLIRRLLQQRWRPREVWINRRFENKLHDRLGPVVTLRCFFITFVFTTTTIFALKKQEPAGHFSHYNIANCTKHAVQISSFREIAMFIFL